MFIFQDEFFNVQGTELVKNVDTRGQHHFDF